MDEKIEPWVEQYRRLREAYSVCPDAMPSATSGRIRFLRTAVIPKEDGTYIKGQRPGEKLEDLAEKHIYGACRRIYSSSKNRYEKLEKILADRKPKFDDSFALLYEMQQLLYEMESAKLDRVFEIVDKKLRCLPSKKQIQILEKYDFMIPEEVWAELHGKVTAEAAPEQRQQTFI